MCVGVYPIVLHSLLLVILLHHIEKSKYLNHMDDKLKTIYSLISPNLLFHISSHETLNEAWTTLEGLFGKQDEMRGHMMEVEILTLDPKVFENIQDLFTKFKDLLSQLKAFGADDLDYFRHEMREEI
jgi:hypothetical protein